MLAQWALKGLEGSTLTEDARAYLMGRGATDRLIETLNLKVWTCPSERSPSADFNDKYGATGGFFEGKLIMPLYSPRNRLLGWDTRSIGMKDAMRTLFPGSGWHPVWIGLRPAMEAVWKGLPVWIVEGLFDLFALAQVITDPILGTGPARLVKNQLHFLRRFASEVNLALDNDSTGRKATGAGLKQLRTMGVECRDVSYRGKDQGEIWDNTGIAGLRDAFARY